MSTDRLTFIAELKDRLTGPAKKAAKAVEDLGKATEKAAAQSEKANTRAERAEAKRARSTQRTVELAVRAEARRAKAAQDAAGRAEVSGRRAITVERRRAQETQRSTERQARAVEQGARRQDKAFSAASIASERARRNHRQATEAMSGGSRRAAQAAESMAGKTTDSMGRMSSSAQKNAGRTQRAIREGLNPASAVSRFRRGLDGAAAHAASVASRINGSMSRAMKWGAVGGGAVAGMALTGGMKRISGLQNTDVILETMGYDPQARQELSDQFQQRALGTRYSTPDVAGLGASLLSSGMQRNKLDTALTGAVDAASVYNLDLNDIAIPLQQIQTKGKLYAEEMVQLQEKRMDIAGWLADYKGVDRAKISDMVTKGQITPDDVFEAIAAATAGGAERAGKTISGSWANFKNAFSMGGAAFLKPLADPLTAGMNQVREMLTSQGASDFLTGLGDRLAPGIEKTFALLPGLFHALAPLRPTVENLFSAAGSALPGMVSGFTNWLNIIVPIVQPFAELTSLIVRGLAPTMPVLVPLFMGFAATMTALKVAGLVGRGVKGLSGAVGGLTDRLSSRNGGTWQTRLFGDRIVDTKDRVQSLAGQGGLGRMNERLDSTTKKMGKAERAAGAFAKGIGLIGLAAAGLDVVGKGIDAVVGDLSTDTSMAGNQIQTGNLDSLDKSFADSAWNKQPMWKRMLIGSDASQANNIGEAITNQAYNQAAPGHKATEWINSKFITTREESQNQAFSDIDSHLAGQAGSREAGAAFARIVDQSVSSGGNERLVLSKFPQYKQAVADKLGTKGMSVDDNSVLQYMKTGGFRRGGYTGDGAVTAPAGVVHGREYVFDAAATARIGVDNLRAMHRGGQVSNNSSSYFSPTINLTVGAGVNPAEVRAQVDHALREAERRQRNMHGTRSKVGAR